MGLIYGQDNEEIMARLKSRFTLDTGDTRYIKRKGITVYDFVGFVISPTETLAVFPKHYFSISHLDKLNKDKIHDVSDVALLFQVIHKYIREDSKNNKAHKYFGPEKAYESDYPFEAFFEVYDYYRRFGLYYEEETHIAKGQRGKISWKDTIQRADVLVSGGNIIFLPLYSKQKNAKSTFLSECMAFVINHTIQTFPFFLEMPPIHHMKWSMDFISHREAVLEQLYRCKRTIFKDMHKRLVEALIRFFETLDLTKEGGNIHLKINFFDKVWESMIEKYLNDCFVGVDEKENKIIFDETQRKSSVRFRSQKFDIDASEHGFSIIPDHYGCSEDAQYIFDSKYYYEVKDLNYKQFTYNVLLSAYVSQSQKKTYSALFLPGHESSKLHLDVKPEYLMDSSKPHRVIEQYLDVKSVMQYYANSRF